MSDAGRRSPALDASGMDGWRRRVRDALGGRDVSELCAHTRDGVAIEPLYARRREGAPLTRRGAGAWTAVQIVDAADPDEAAGQARADLKGGATGFALRLAGAPSAAGRGLPPRADALHIALEAVDPAGTHLRLEPHADASAAAQWLRDIVETSGVAAELTDISFGLDPVAAIAGHGVAPDSAALGACVGELSAAGFRGSVAACDGRVYHEAGATEAQELAGVLATAAWWLRTLDASGIAPAQGVALLGVSLSADRDQLLSIAKLRAMRLLWARLQELCGARREPLALHVETSGRMLTRADAHTNLLRNTVAAFAAAAGGADSVAVLPHTLALGRADGDARALALNTQLLLIEEAHLHRVADPGGGSGAIEALTEALAAQAWAELQRIESEGGIVASLGAGAFQARIADARRALAAELAAGVSPLVGATLHPAPNAKSDAESAAEAPPQRHGGLAALDLTPVRLEELAEAAA